MHNRWQTWAGMFECDALPVLPLQGKQLTGVATAVAVKAPGHRSIALWPRVMMAGQSCMQIRSRASLQLDLCGHACRCDTLPMQLCALHSWLVLGKAFKHNAKQLFQLCTAVWAGQRFWLHS